MPDEVRRGIHVAIPFFLGNLRGNVDVLVLSFAVAQAPSEIMARLRVSFRLAR